jgi:hypothetical protein
MRPNGQWYYSLSLCFRSQCHGVKAERAGGVRLEFGHVQ